MKKKDGISTLPIFWPDHERRQTSSYVIYICMHNINLQIKIILIRVKNIIYKNKQNTTSVVCGCPFVAQRVR